MPEQKCLLCGLMKKHYGRGYCETCYRKVRGTLISNEKELQLLKDKIYSLEEEVQTLKTEYGKSLMDLVNEIKRFRGVFDDVERTVYRLKNLR